MRIGNVSLIASTSFRRLLGRRRLPRRSRAEGTFDVEPQRLHYLSVPPKAALSAVHLLDEAGLVERSRVIMEKPFGVDLESAVALNAQLHEVFRRIRSSGLITSSARSHPEHPGVPVRERAL